MPHGISVVVGAPAIFRFLAEAAPERHLEAAEHLGADLGGAVPDDAGEVLSKRLIELMRATHAPNGLTGVGFEKKDVRPMAESAVRQARGIANAPRVANLDEIESIYKSALQYW